MRVNHSQPDKHVEGPDQSATGSSTGSAAESARDTTHRVATALQHASDKVGDAFNHMALTARAGVRSTLSRLVFPVRSESAQKEAGEASAQAVLSGGIPTAKAETDGSLSDQIPADRDLTSEVLAGSTAGSTADTTTDTLTDATDDTEHTTDQPALEDLSDPEFAGIAARHEITPVELLTGLDNLHGASAAAGGSNRVNAPDPSIPQDEGVAAFFDVDNTLIKGASILLFARGLARRRFFTTGEITGFVWKQLKYRVSGTEDADDIASGREQALALVKGHKEAEVVQMAEEIWAATIAERIFPGTKELADMHLQAGHQVWLVTATPVQLAQVIARELGFTGALGTVAEVKDGVFTGRMVGDILHGSGKKHAVAALAAHENFDLERCTAYSDSVNDLPLLSMVGTAVAVNPDSQLRKAARANGWEIRDYRRGRRVLRTFGAAAAGAGAAAAGGRWIKRH